MTERIRGKGRGRAAAAVDSAPEYDDGVAANRRLGYVAVCRSIKHHPLLRDNAAYLGLWTWMLAEAAWRPTTVYRGKSGTPVHLEPGQLVLSASTGVLGMSEQTLRTALNRMQRAGMISVESQRTTGRKITIVKWLEYQEKDDQPTDDQRTTQRTTNGRPTDDQRTAQEVNQLRNIRTPSESGADAAAPEPEPPPAVDLAKALFDIGVAVLTEQGHSPKAARAFLGKCRKEAGSDGIVIDAIGRALRERATDAAGFIAAIVKRQSRSPPAAADWQREMAERLCGNGDGGDGDGQRGEDQAGNGGGHAVVERLGRRATGH